SPLKMQLMIRLRSPAFVADERGLVVCSPQEDELHAAGLLARWAGALAQRALELALFTGLGPCGCEDDDVRFPCVHGEPLCCPTAPTGRRVVRFPFGQPGGDSCDRLLWSSRARAAAADFGEVDEKAL